MESGPEVFIEAASQAPGIITFLIEQAIGNKKAVELTVRFDDDPDSVVFVQQYSRKEKFNVGDRVRVIYGNDRVRVAP